MKLHKTNSPESDETARAKHPDAADEMIPDASADIDTLDLSQVHQYAVILDLTAGTWPYTPPYGPVWTITGIPRSTHRA